MQMYWQINNEHILWKWTKWTTWRKSDVSNHCLDRFCLAWPWLRFSGWRSIWAGEVWADWWTFGEGVDILTTAEVVLPNTQARTLTRTHTNTIHFLYYRNDPEFEALLYLRLLQFLPWLTQGLKTKKWKTGTWAEKNYWAAIQKPNTRLKQIVLMEKYHTDVQ